MKNSENINRPLIRRQLIDRYLNSETTPEEERLLADYFLHHTPEKGEEDIALMLMAMQEMTSPDPTILSDAEQVFDALIRGSHPLQNGESLPLPKDASPWKVRLFAISGIAATILVMLVMTWGYHARQGKGASMRPETVAMTQETVSLPRHHSPTGNRVLPSVATSQELSSAQVLHRGSSHQASPTFAKKKAVPTKSHQHEDSMTVMDLIAKLQNFQALASANDEQIELRPVGDAAIITTSDSSGTRRSYLSVGLAEYHTLSFLVLDN